MIKIISVHSFRRGTGKSTLLANTAVLLLQAGYRTGLVDMGLAAPSLPILFGIDESEFPYAINDYIWGQCDIEACTYDITAKLDLNSPPGHLFLTPASTHHRQIARILRGGYYLNLIGDACHEVAQQLQLDFLLVDTQAGLNEESQLITALSDAVIIITRPDRQDWQGTAILAAVAQQLACPYTLLVVNQVSDLFTQTAVETEFEKAFACDSTAVLPHSQELLLLGSSRLFVLQYPTHPITATLQEIVDKLTNDQ